MNEAARDTVRATAAQADRATPAVVRAGRRRASIADGLASVVAIVVALLFFFPLYWAISNSLRRPAETFTVTGLGIRSSTSRRPWRTGASNSACRNSTARS